MPQFKTSLDAYAHAYANGFKYSRCRIGFSIYRTTEKVLEIGHDYAAFYRAGSAPKKSRLIEICRYSTRED